MLVEFVNSKIAPKSYQGACSAVSLKTIPYLSYPPAWSVMYAPSPPPPKKIKKILDLTLYYYILVYIYVYF